MNQFKTKNNRGPLLDRTYCASPNCVNECGRKMLPDQEKELKRMTHSRVSFAYFCGEPEC